MDSLLFYTALFHSFLKRVFKMDLTASKNAYMLFRVTKVGLIFKTSMFIIFY